MKKRIYIIVGQFKGDYIDKYTTGIMKQANELGYDTICFSMSRLSRTKSSCEKDLYNLIDFSKCDGVVLNVDSFYEMKNLATTLENVILQSGKPYTVIGTPTFTENYFHYPYYNDMYKMMEHLIEDHGCQKIYCLGDVPDYPSSRLEAFKDAMKQHNLPCPQSYFLYGGFWIDCAERLAKDIAFDNIERPDAIMCISDQIAMALVKALYRNGIRVPDDVMVAGLDGHPCAFNYIMPITTIGIDGEHLGRTAMNRLHEMLGNEVEIVPIKKSRIIKGLSCGCSVTKSNHVRSRLERDDEYEKHEMFYRNSEIQEKLFHITSYSDLPFIIDNLTYLVPNMHTFSVSLIRGANKAECLFHSYWPHGDKTVMFDYRDILPPNSNMDNQVRNIHVVPVVFQDKFYGYATAGFHNAIVYNEFLLRFVRDISIAIDIYENNSIDEENHSYNIPKPERTTTKVYNNIRQVDDDLEDLNNSDTANVIYALKDGLLVKVNQDNILYFEAYDKKVNVVVKSGEYEIKNTLMELETMMLHRNYMRISKSILLNLDKVAAIRPEADRTVVVVLTNKQTVRVSRKYSKDFRDKMQF